VTPRDVNDLRARLESAATTAARLAAHAEDLSCSIKGCGRPVVTRGWCTTHYGRWRRTGDPLGWVRVLIPEGAICAIADCEIPVYARGWCHRHYKRWLKHGDPEVNYPRAIRVDSNGYRFLPQVNGVRILEHRAVLLAVIGPGEHPCFWCGATVSWDADRRDPRKLVVDHFDGDRLNNDPANLLPSCSACNARRSARGRPRRPVCAKGHPMEGKNLYVSPEGRRHCRACARDRDRTRRLRKSEARVAQ